jgi:hypothetical protein
MRPKLTLAALNFIGVTVHFRKVCSARLAAYRACRGGICFSETGVHNYILGIVQESRGRTLCRSADLVYDSRLVLGGRSNRIDDHFVHFVVRVFYRDEFVRWRR